ncbi:ABC-2 family transporter protein [Patescibacteria group bacterium]|nr:ABC-2 family transporter protein [Patescibacteria group bacterium]MCG2701706.1 ABC-2 family transporter protein [Candidatus Parcubacteria bacterium]MBU4265359.1 ABC-2 family transporter protein [Patescibacteria group bacterium]MBU4390311.1 ABC-2 family transporter protein [Patescibacteria group bacterium]MBU4396558.1 ABC-2 family transporter protein [Patescibacteria group bacterium]
MKKIKRYLKIYWKLIKFSATLETTYRMSFLLEIIVEVGYFVVTVMGMKVLFWNIKTMAGWNLYEIMVLYGLNMIFAEIVLGVAFIFNLRGLPEKIANGELDLILIKPLNSQFMVSLWRPYFALIPSMLAGVIMMVFGFKLGNLVFNWLSLFPFMIIFGCGLVVAYSVGMMVVTLSMWLVQATPLPMLAQKFLFMAKEPFSIYGGAWRFVFLVILPLAFMVSFPTQVLLGELVWWWIPMGLVMAVVFLKMSNVFWNFALKSYSSASS